MQLLWRNFKEIIEKIIPILLICDSRPAEALILQGGGVETKIAENPEILLLKINKTLRGPKKFSGAFGAGHLLSRGGGY